MRIKQFADRLRQRGCGSDHDGGDLERSDRAQGHDKSDQQIRQRGPKRYVYRGRQRQSHANRSVASEHQRRLVVHEYHRGH